MNKRLLCLVFGITLLVTMGISSLIPSLPRIALAYGVPVEGSWRVIAAFALPGLVCIPFVGVLADRFGRKAVLLPALLLFALGGVACAFARTFPELLLFRMLQGTGSAPLGLLYATIIADAWQGNERVRAMSWNAMVLGLGTALSPALGGALAMLHWKLPFALPLLALPVAVLALGQPLLRPASQSRLSHYLQAVLACTAHRQTRALLLLTLLTFLMLSGPIITCFPLLAELSFSATPLESGLVIAAASFASGLAAVLLPRLYQRHSTRTLLLAAVLLYCLGFAGIALTTSFWWLLPPMLLYGLGQGLNIPLVSTLLTGQAPDAQRGALMAVNALLLRLGQNIGPAVFGLLAGGWGPGPAIGAGCAVALAMAAVVWTVPLPTAGERLAPLPGAAV